MSSFSQDQLFEIKSRVNLADLLEEYGLQVKRTGGSAKVCCPFHKEKTPSFHINLERNFYKCFGCGESGDVLTFVQKYEGLTFVDALKKLADRAGVKLEQKRSDPEAKLRERLYAIHQELAAFYQRCLVQTREGQIARDYLQQRHLDEAIVKQFQIGYAPDRNDAILLWAQKHNYTPEELVAAGILATSTRDPSGYYDRFRGRLVFPICDTQGRVVAFSCRLLRDRKNTGKYVNSPETAIFKKSNVLYALHHARANIVKSSPRRALICEGQIDVIRCHACGFNTAIASQGTAFTEEHVTLLKRYADTVDILFDGDNAGVKAAIRTLGLFLAQGLPVRIANLPEGEDPDSFLLRKGEAAFRECLDRAIDPAPYLVARLREQEAHPDAMDAMMRIARTAILSIVDCPEPILTARFIKDLADIIGLPPNVLDDDLQHLRANAAEAAKRREAFNEARQNTPATLSTAHSEETLPVDDGMSEDFIPDMDDEGAFVIEDER
ncbi:MAG: DNA primase, partial [bacterium]|nr:DNA primase [bacterium]